MIRLSAAVSQNGVIGKNGHLPWTYPEDIKLFHKVTQHSVLIMGRKTFESIGKPLPKRETIIISSGLNYWHEEGVQAYPTVSSALSDMKARPWLYGEADIWLCGGTEVYREGMAYASEIWLTLIPEVVEGKDMAYFPFVHPGSFMIDSIALFEIDRRLRLVKYKRTV